MKKGNPIFYSTILLTGANFLLRLAGISFQVYLSNRIGAAGIGLLQLVLSVSALSFTVGSAGIRTCAMYLSAGELGRNRPDNVHSVLTGCFRYSLLFSGMTAAALWWAAPWLSRVWIGDGAATAALRLCALFLPLRCLRGVLTGYLTAAQRVGSLVAAAFLEQGCAMSVTFLLLSRRVGVSSGQAALAMTAGSCAADALGFLVLLRLRERRVPRRKRRPPYGQILQVSLPLALADALRSGLNTIEDVIIPRQLTLFAGTVNAMADYGMIRGMVFPVLMFPAAILFSLAELLVPEFSRCAAGRRTPRIRYLVRRGLRVSLLFSLCAAGVLFAGADALGELLYHDQAVGPALRLYAPLIPLLYTDAIVDAVCKGLGQQNANARYNLLTSFLDVSFLWLLLPQYGLNGYYLSFAVTHLINFCLSLRRLLRVSGARLETGLSLRALLCAGAAGWSVTLLPKTPGLRGVLLPGAWYLAVLFLLWTLLRVVRWGDLLWLRGLAQRHGRRT